MCERLSPLAPAQGYASPAAPQAGQPESWAWSPPCACAHAHARARAPPHLLAHKRFILSGVRPPPPAFCPELPVQPSIPELQPPTECTAEAFPAPPLDLQGEAVAPGAADGAHRAPSPPGTRDPRRPPARPPRVRFPDTGAASSGRASTAAPGPGAPRSTPSAAWAQLLATRRDSAGPTALPVSPSRFGLCCPSPPSLPWSGASRAKMMWTFPGSSAAQQRGQHLSPPRAAAIVPKGAQGRAFGDLVYRLLT